MEKIGIIGKGAFGEAIFHLISHRNEPTLSSGALIYDKNPETNPTVKSLEELFRRTEIVFIAIPSSHTTEIIAEIAPLIIPQHIIVLLSKGMAGDRLLPEVIAEVTDSYAILSGAMLAAEIEHNLPAGATLSAPNQKILDQLIPLFPEQDFVLTTNTNPRGTALLGILKNVYAIGLGAGRAYNLGNNWIGLYVSAVTKELQKICKNQHIDFSLALGPAGLADLVATGLSPLSCNASAGAIIATQEKSYIPTCEGTLSLPHLKEYLADFDQLSILKGIHDFINETNQDRQATIVRQLISVS